MISLTSFFNSRIEENLEGIIAKDLFSVSRIKGFTFDVELMYISLKRNYDIKKIPVSLRSQEGNSVNVLKHGFKMVVDLFVIKLNHLRGFYTNTD